MLGLDQRQLHVHLHQCSCVSHMPPPMYDVIPPLASSSNRAYEPFAYLACGSGVVFVLSCACITPLAIVCFWRLYTAALYAHQAVSLHSPYVCSSHVAITQQYDCIPLSIPLCTYISGLCIARLTYHPPLGGIDTIVVHLHNLSLRSTPKCGNIKLYLSGLRHFAALSNGAGSYLVHRCGTQHSAQPTIAQDLVLACQFIMVLCLTHP